VGDNEASAVPDSSFVADALVRQPPRIEIGFDPAEGLTTSASSAKTRINLSGFRGASVQAQFGRNLLHRFDAKGDVFF
jgi:hypothetical protein